MECTPKVRHEVKGPNTLNGEVYGFGPKSVQPESEDCSLTLTIIAIQLSGSYPQQYGSISGNGDGVARTRNAGRIEVGRAATIHQPN